MQNKKLWFKRKLYGWGWTPSSWEGWLVTAIYLFVAIFIFRNIDQTSHSGSDTLIGFVLPFIVITLLLIFICYKKGETPKWQWGRIENEAKLPCVGIGVMIWKDGKILMGKRKGSHGAGTYAFPGGHLEYMEGFEECARRETLEETGIEIKNIRFNFVANEIHPEKHLAHIGLVADWASGEVQLLEPHKCEGWDWYAIDQLPSPAFSMLSLAVESYKTGKKYYDK
jgi:8-oxo-dGTP diphosphatase